MFFKPSLILSFRCTFAWRTYGIREATQACQPKPLKGHAARLRQLQLLAPAIQVCRTVHKTWLDPRCFQARIEKRTCYWNHIDFKGFCVAMIKIPCKQRVALSRFDDDMTFEPSHWHAELDIRLNLWDLSAQTMLTLTLDAMHQRFGIVFARRRPSCDQKNSNIQKPAHPGQATSAGLTLSPRLHEPLGFCLILTPRVTSLARSLPPCGQAAPAPGCTGPCR